MHLGALRPGGYVVEMRSNLLFGCFLTAEHEYNVQKDLGAPRGATPSWRRRLQGLDSIIWVDGEIC